MNLQTRATHFKTTKEHKPPSTIVVNNISLNQLHIVTHAGIVVVVVVVDFMRIFCE